MSTEPAPPSIPPRNRTSGAATRPGASSSGVSNGSASNGSAAAVTPAASEPSDKGRSSEPGFGPRRSHDAAASRLSGSASGASTPSSDDLDDVPSPLQVAVDSVTSSLKKAAAAASAAIGSATHSRTEDHAMTGTTNTAPLRTSGAQAPRPASGRIPTVSATGAPRRVRLAVSRIDPWSVMKLSFLLSVALGIILVIAAAVIWFALDSMHVFAQVDTLIREVLGAESNIDILQYVSFSRILSAATMIAVVDVVLLTALSTIAAFLYNITAALVGGVHLTMTDE
ncbi:MAG: DUF3566 domain-containing protein [Cellulomonas sp.]